jgi:hypothetical protein
LITRGLTCASDFEVYSLHGPTEMGFAQKGEVALPVWSLSRREKSSPSHFLQSHGDAIV